jgi:hypothetical protein
MGFFFGSVPLHRMPANTGFREFIGKQIKFCILGRGEYYFPIILVLSLYIKNISKTGCGANGRFRGVFGRLLC